MFSLVMWASVASRPERACTCIPGCAPPTSSLSTWSRSIQRRSNAVVPPDFFFFFFGFSFLCVVVCSECGGVGYASVSDGSDCEDKELLDDEHDSHLAALRAPAEDTSLVAAELSNDLAF